MLLLLFRFCFIIYYFKKIIKKKLIYKRVIKFLVFFIIYNISIWSQKSIFEQIPSRNIWFLSFTTVWSYPVVFMKNWSNTMSGISIWPDLMYWRKGMPRVTSLGGHEQPTGVLKPEEHCQTVYNGRFDSNQGNRNAKFSNTGTSWTILEISEYLKCPV